MKRRHRRAEPAGGSYVYKDVLPGSGSVRAGRLLERLGLHYLVTGSVATIFFGEPRFTAATVTALLGGEFAGADET